jgi:hypothetical protein
MIDFNLGISWEALHSASELGATMTELSLFTNDPFRRLLTKLRLAQNGRVRYRLLLPAVIAIGWVVPFLLTVAAGRLFTTQHPFFHDLNRPIQTIICLIFLLAQPLVDEHVRNAGEIFASSGILAEGKEYEPAALTTRHLRESLLPDVVVLLLACAATALWVNADLHKGFESWSVIRANGRYTLTLAGWWNAIVWSQLYGFCWIQWAWKILIWTGFLCRMARSKLSLAVGHPDEVAGLAFVGETQAAFAVVIFGVGLLVALDAINQVVIEGTPAMHNIVAEVLGFVLLAPLAFLSPLLMFTKQLYLAKQEGLKSYGILLTQFINAFERRHLSNTCEGGDSLAATADLAALANIETLHSHLEKMRIVPFDLGSLFHLGAAAVSPMLPLAIHFIPWLRWVKDILPHSVE